MKNEGRFNGIVVGSFLGMLFVVSFYCLVICSLQTLTQEIQLVLQERKCLVTFQSQNKV
jgi:hypothetical protein